MKDCFKRFFLPSFSIVIFASAFFAGCVDVDDQLGLGFLPDDKEMVFTEDIVGGIKSYMAFNTDMPVDQLNRMVLGNYQTDGFGHIRSGALIQFVPSSFGSSSNYYGFKPHIDSVFLRLEITEIHGDTTVDQKFYVYQMTKDLPNGDRIFYYPVPLGEKFLADTCANMTDPLFSFSMRGKQVGSADVRLNVEPAGEIFLQELIDVDTLLYQEEGLFDAFREMFKGFYITPSPDEVEAPKNSALYVISPMASYDSSYGYLTDETYFFICGHNHYNPDDPEDTWDEDDDEPDTDTHDGVTYHIKNIFTNDSSNSRYPVIYSFFDNYYEDANTNVMVLERSYAGSLVDPDDFVDTDDFVSGTLANQSPIYIQGLLGVAGYLDLDGDFIDNLRALSVYEGEERILNVNRARLYVWLEDGNDVDKLDKAPTRLGMYYDYSGYDDYDEDNPDNTVTFGGRKPYHIPDYNYVYEQAYSTSLSYGGYINRATGYYEMDITMYIRDLLTDEDTPKQVWLAPGATSDVLFTPSQVAIQNPYWNGVGDPPKTAIQLKLTYTLLKKTIDQ
ncbi:MAG: DUF4270 domain-containing protein [Rikenellaceae bacterium]|nr:DUF4270 domain-containing protein [Rikenellaceae bacterium]